MAKIIFISANELTIFYIVLQTLIFSVSAVAETENERDQDKRYIDCLIRRDVSPQNIQKTHEFFCLKEAGVQDPGADIRAKRKIQWQNCILANSKKLDDGISTAETVAKAVVGYCETEWRNVVLSLWMFPYAKNQMIGDINKAGVSAAIPGVLMSRKGSIHP